MINLLYEGVDKQLKRKDDQIASLGRLLREARYFLLNSNMLECPEDEARRIASEIHAALDEENP